MIRGMQLFLYFLAFLLCFGPKLSNADSSNNIPSKRKFITISNKAKDDAIVQCKSDKQNLNKTLKPGEKIRWGLGGVAAPTAICHVDLGGVNGYLSAFVEKHCKRECKWRVLDDGVLKLKLAGGEWKSFQLMADKEAAKDSDRHHSCDDDDDEDEDEDENVGIPGKGKQDSEMKSSTRGAKSAPPPTKQIRRAPAPDSFDMKHGPSKSIPTSSRSPALAPEPLTTRASTKSRAASPPKQAKKGRKLKHKNARSPKPASKNRKKKSRGQSAPPPMKRHHKGKPRTGDHSRSQAPSPAQPTLASIKSRALSPIQNTHPPKKQGHWRLKPRHPRSAVSPNAHAPHQNKKMKSVLSMSKSTMPPTQEVEKVSKNHRNAPSPMKHTHEKSRPRNSRSPAPELPASTKPHPPTKHGRRKLKPRHPRSTPVPIKAPAPENEKTEFVELSAIITAPPPILKHSHEKSRLRNSRSSTSTPAPAPELLVSTNSRAPSPTNNSHEKSGPGNSGSSAPTKSRAPPPSKQMKKAPALTKQGRRKLKPRHPMVPNAIHAPPPTKHDHGKSGYENFPKQKAPEPVPAHTWNTKSAPTPSEKMHGDTKSPPSGNEKQKPGRHGAEVAPPPPKKQKPINSTPENGKQKPVRHGAEVAQPPKQQKPISSPSENGKQMPGRHGAEVAQSPKKQKPISSPSENGKQKPGRHGAEVAPPPKKQKPISSPSENGKQKPGRHGVEVTPPPKEQNPISPPPENGKQKPGRHGTKVAPPPKKQKPISPPPKNEKEKPGWHGAEVAPPPKKQKSPPESGKEKPGRHGAEMAPPPRKQKPISAPTRSPLPPPREGGDESDGELPPLPRPGSTFYTCIKEESRLLQ